MSQYVYAWDAIQSFAITCSSTPGFPVLLSIDVAAESRIYGGACFHLLLRYVKSASAQDNQKATQGTTF